MIKMIIIIFTTFLIVSISGIVRAIGTASDAGAAEGCHDFSHESWLSVSKSCRMCHVPHRRRGRKRINRYANGLRWNPKITSFTYNLFNSFWSSSLTGMRDMVRTTPVTSRQGGLPDGLSKLCLSCHNGIIAPDVYNLHHFISLEYDVTKTELREPDFTAFGVSGPISEILFDGKIQCPSCHDPHNEENVANTKLLRVDKLKICITCHKK